MGAAPRAGLRLTATPCDQALFPDAEARKDDAQKVKDYARRTGLPASTPTSLTTLQGLEKELEKVRRHGVAFDLDEVENGVRCIAAGIRNDSGELVAGLSLSTPSERFDADWAPLIRETADEISHSLGYIQPPAR